MIHARDDYTERIQDRDGLIPDDEPVLLIRGQDVLAVPMIDEYLDRYAELAGTDASLIDVLEAHRERVEAWQRSHTPKVADL